MIRNKQGIGCALGNQSPYGGVFQCPMTVHDTKSRSVSYRTTNDIRLRWTLHEHIAKSCRAEPKMVAGQSLTLQPSK